MNRFNAVRVQKAAIYQFPVSGGVFPTPRGAISVVLLKGGRGGFQVHPGPWTRWDQTVGIWSMLQTQQTSQPLHTGSGISQIPRLQPPLQTSRGGSLFRDPQVTPGPRRHLCHPPAPGVDWPGLRSGQVKIFPMPNLLQFLLQG